MKHRFCRVKFLVSIAVLALSVGCGSSSNSLLPSRQSFVYVANQGSQNISAFKRSPSAGTLTPVAGSPFAATVPLNLFTSLEVDPKNQFLFALVGGQLAVFVIDPTTGAPSPASGSPFSFPACSTRSLSVDPQGRFVYVGTQCAGILGWRIDRTNHVLVPLQGSPFGDVGTTYGTAVDPAGKFLYAAEMQDISTFAIDPGTGSLTLANGPFYIPGEAPEYITMHPSGTFAYVFGENQELNTELWDCIVNPVNGAVSAFQNENQLYPSAITPDGKFFISPPGIYKVIDSGQLLEVSPTSALSGVDVVSSDSQFIYSPAAGRSQSDPGSVSVFSLDETTGATTMVPGSPYPVGAYPTAIALTH